MSKPTEFIRCNSCNNAYHRNSHSGICIKSIGKCEHCSQEEAEPSKPTAKRDRLKKLSEPAQRRLDSAALPYASFDLGAGKDKSATCDFFSFSEDTPMRLIGIAGPARSGKDTLASYLLEHLTDDWQSCSFASPIKSMLGVIGVDWRDDVKDSECEVFGASPRKMMQTLGTDWGRQMIGEDIWVKAFARINAGKQVVVPDVRFENEADLVRANGILIHLVGRGGIDGNHVSENKLPFKEGDIVIDNSRSIDWMYAQVKSHRRLLEVVFE